MITYDCSTDGNNCFGFDSYEPDGLYEDSIKDDLYYKCLYREWKEYIKTLWLDVLKTREYVCVHYLETKLFYRRRLISISGRLSKVGHSRKN
ncbi:MAG: hypothetical protein EHM49_00110 [Deltaproteobacteria bacterium]|nr:MAG: hypothetical protein EHM49_09125 [Deltaproteobacteria bacterium]RPI56430.1 MAG: hypothetical protein EHM49_00110 [Deltaproteobacteria bacterium]